MYAIDWMSLAFERFQSATRSVRLTLPPNQDALFWQRIVELSKIKQFGLSISILLDTSPDRLSSVEAALRALPQLDLNGHEVSWSAVKGFPFSLFIIDNSWVMTVVGNPDTTGDNGLVWYSGEKEQSSHLCRLFDEKAEGGIWGIDPYSWLETIHRQAEDSPFSRALRTRERAEARLKKITTRTLRKLPSRSCWLVKPYDSSYGLTAPPGKHYWHHWLEDGIITTGMESLLPHLTENALEDQEVFNVIYKRLYPASKGYKRTFSVLRTFSSKFYTGDRVAALDGWNARQIKPVKFYGWTLLPGKPGLSEENPGLTTLRKVEWRAYEIDIPVDQVRKATGLQSSTFPIHKVHIGAFRRLLEIAMEIRREQSLQQLSLALPEEKLTGIRRPFMK